MKIICWVLFLILSFMISSCQRSAAVNTEFSVNADKESNSKSENRTSIVDSNADKSSNSSDFKVKYPVLWNATIRHSDLIDTKNELELYSYDENQYDKPEDKNSSFFKARSGVEVDLMNCSGYLASGRLYASDDSNSSVPDWKLKISPETIAKDAKAKIERCNLYKEQDSAKDKVPLSNAFAVAPMNKSRVEITISDIDTKKVFVSLPEDIKEWANSKVNLEFWKREKDNLTLSHDSWADLDGDGKIDLVYIYGYDDEEHGYGIVLYLINGKWKNIGGSSPA